MLMIACGKQATTEKNKSDAIQQLQEVVDGINNECPISLGEYIQVDGLGYSEDVVTIYYALSSDVLKMSDVRSNKETFRRNLLIGMANNQDESFRMLVELMQNADAGLRILFGSIDNGCIEFNYSLKEIEDAFMDSANDKEVLLQTMADNAELQTPQTIDEGLVMTAVYIKDKCFTYEYSCDENLYDMDAMNQSKESAKEAILETLKSDDPILSQLRKTIKECNYRMAYKYVGDTSGEFVVISIYPDEL